MEKSNEYIYYIRFSEVEKIDGLEFIEMDDKLYIKRGLYMFTPSDILS